MLYLVILTFGVFFLFWFGDLYITLKAIKKKDNGVEINPLLRFIFDYRRKFAYLFKTIEIAAFSYLIYYITSLNGKLSFNILLGFIFVYGLVVVNNAHVYYKITGEEIAVFKIIFVLLTIFLILFIYLNYLLYTDLNVTYNAMSDFNLKYYNLYKQCYATNNTEVPTMEVVLKDLNLTVR